MARNSKYMARNEELPRYGKTRSYDYFYVYENFAPGNFGVVKQIKIEDKNKEYIASIEARIGENNGVQTIGSTSELNRLFEILKSRTGRNHSDNAVDTGRRGDSRNGRVSLGESESNRIGYNRKGVADNETVNLSEKDSVKASREGPESATSAVRVFSGELTDTGRENLRKTKKALNALNKKGGTDVSLIVVEDIPGTNGIKVGDRIYITRAALDSGKHLRTLVHEYTHFEEGTREYAKLIKFYASDKAAFEKAIRDVIDSGYGITESDVLNIISKKTRGEKLTDEELTKKQTLISEANAKMSEAILGNEQFIIADTNLNLIRLKLYKSALSPTSSFASAATCRSRLTKKSSGLY